MKPVEHAQAAAEAIRALNHATLHPNDPAGYEWPSDVDRVIGALDTMATRMVQALSQARRWLDDAERAGQVGHDQDAHLGTVMIEVDDRLCTAIAATAALAADLSAVRSITNHLTGID